MNLLTALDASTREGVVLLGLVAILLLGAVLVLVLRTRAIPICWNCGFHSVRRSQSRRLLDTLASLCLLCPYRCEKCLERFYCFGIRRLPGSHTRSHSMTAAGRS
jgi:hypothetical protein